MSYNPNTPANINEKFSISQPKITANFTQIKTAWDVNHVTFDDVPNEGKHKFVTLPVQTAAPTTLATETALYCKNNGTVNSLFVRKPNDGDEIDLLDATFSNPGHQVLPSGLIMAWGTITMPPVSPNIVQSGFLVLTKAITNVYSFTYGVTSSNAAIAEATNIILTSYSVAGVNVTITRKHSIDPAVFNVLIIGK